MRRRRARARKRAAAALVRGACATTAAPRRGRARRGRRRSRRRRGGGQRHARARVPGGGGAHVAKHGTAPKMFRRVERSAPPREGKTPRRATSPVIARARADAAGAPAGNVPGASRASTAPRSGAPPHVRAASLRGPRAGGRDRPGGLDVAGLPSASARPRARAGRPSLRAPVDFGDPALNDSRPRSSATSSPPTRTSRGRGRGSTPPRLLRGVVSPVRFQRLFVGLLAPWLRPALRPPEGRRCCEGRRDRYETTFNIGASTVISKWRGDS